MVYFKAATPAATYSLTAASTTATLLLHPTGANTKTVFDASLNFAYVYNLAATPPTYVLYKFLTNTYTPIISTGLADTFSTV